MPDPTPRTRSGALAPNGIQQAPPDFLTTDDAITVLTVWQDLTAPQRDQMLAIMRDTARLNRPQGAEAAS
ncbi:hypothetical protein F1188_20155 [Roseospira marina]|uniref:Uncharacterized protein n=1 Tax=Roseospira marina TaxID=140057 RepID=A0A5M6I473_9PROT|nr:hypothetical protein [Roseospira marina]KAA5603000.1 hypothetical protein F1188_20155 [Roseospira marina]MBB4313038.1 hypothetical protein [Roseospira marina]MBB5089301.1 hypothetical protein [Roseospira marina]